MPDFLTGSVQAYLDQLASGDPTPGGGSAAALAGAMGASLLCMSARFTVGREKYASYEEAATMVITVAEGLRAELQQLCEDDAAAYANYRAASALPKATEDEKAARAHALQVATRASAIVPLEIARRCHRLLDLAQTLSTNCNPYLVSDVVVATHMAVAGFRSAILNVRMNLAVLKDAEFVAATETELTTMVVDTMRHAHYALAAGYEVLNLPLEGDIPE